VNPILRHPKLAQRGDSRPPPISRSPPIAAFSIMSTRIDFIGHTLILIRTLRLSMRDLLWGFDTTIRLGDGISKNVTWIHLCRRRAEVQACNEGGRGWSILLDFWANLWAASDLYRAAEISAAKLTIHQGRAVTTINCYCFFLFAFHEKHRRNEIT
jgi:hypothetical protein